MRRVAVVQARTTSTRLPGKVLQDLAGAPMLARQIVRIRRAKNLDAIVLATTSNASDDPIVELAKREDVAFFRGSESDVLARYVGAAAEARADVVVRITSDCPLIDPEVVDQVIAALLAEPADYASNVLERRYPRGLDVEAFHADVLSRVDRMATSRPSREHVTWFIHAEHPELFVKTSVVGPRQDADLRWTVDTPEDLALVRKIYADLDLTRSWKSHAEIVAHVRAHPELCAMNASVAQKTS